MSSRAVTTLVVVMALVACVSAFNLTDNHFPELAVQLNAIGPGQNRFTISRPEGTRVFFAWVPSNYFQNKDQYSLVIAWHGMTNDCEVFGPEKGFQNYAGANKFIYVYPCGYKGLLGNAWNAGTCCLRGSSIDDITLAKSIISTMQANFRINKARIFSVGFSNGAMMSETLACTNPSLFKGIASVAGTTVMEPGNSKGIQACTAKYTGSKVSVLLIHGDADWVVPWGGDVLLGFPSIPDNSVAWRARNGCGSTATVTINNANYKNEKYTCASNTKFEVVRAIRLGHKWPADNVFDATKYIVQFINSL